MKKLAVLILALTAGFSSVFAQIEDSKMKQDDGFGVRTPKKQDDASSASGGFRPDIIRKHYNYELSIGLRGAVGYSTMAESDNLSIADGGMINYGGGLAVNMRFGGKDSKGRALDGQGLFGIGLEVNYKNQGSKIKGNDNLSLSCIEVPLMLQFYPCYSSKHLKNLYIEVGPTFSGVLSCSPDVIKNGSATYKTSGIKGYDIKATIGAGYRFSKMSANDGFYVNARYYLGTSNLAGNFPGKVSSAELSVGYNFKCIGTKK